MAENQKYVVLVTVTLMRNNLLTQAEEVAEAEAKIAVDAVDVVDSSLTLAKTESKND